MANTTVQVSAVTRIDSFWRHGNSRHTTMGKRLQDRIAKHRCAAPRQNQRAPDKHPRSTAPTQEQSQHACREEGNNQAQDPSCCGNWLSDARDCSLVHVKIVIAQRPNIPIDRRVEKIVSANRSVASKGKRSKRTGNEANEVTRPHSRVLVNRGRCCTGD